MEGTSSGLLDLQGSIMHMHHPQQMYAPLHHHHHHHHNPNQSHPPMHDASPPPATHMQQECCRPPPHPAVDRTMTSYEDDPSLNTEDGADGHDEAGKGQKMNPWHRVKWTDGMVRLLITAVSYAGGDAASECHQAMKRKASILQKKGKWKCISKVMGERGCYVSPQQCEDKFNDLNKRYKRLVEILGRGTSCMVVEHPVLLDSMDHLTDKVKDDVRKILSSKQLFYEEMCSYHNGNRLHLPADPALQRSLQLALRSRDEHDIMSDVQEDADGVDQGAEPDDVEYGIEGNDTLCRDVGASCIHKRMKPTVKYEQVSFGVSPDSHDFIKKPHNQGISVDMNQVILEGTDTDWTEKQWVSSNSLQLEEQRLQIQAETLELEQQRLKWQRFSRKKDQELDKMRMENERMKLENEYLRLELKRKMLELNHK